jgi:hypothetical protein
LDRLASQAEKESWDAHRAIANWIEHFVDMTVPNIVATANEGPEEAGRQNSEEDGNPYVELSPDLEDDEEDVREVAS